MLVHSMLSVSPQNTPISSSFSLHPPASPAFYPFLSSSPLFAPNAFLSSSSTSSVASASPLLLSAPPPPLSLSGLQPLSAHGNHGAACSTIFLHDAAVNDVTIELSSLPSTGSSTAASYAASLSSLVASGAHLSVKPRSVFTSQSSSSVSVSELSDDVSSSAASFDVSSSGVNVDRQHSLANEEALTHVVHVKRQVEEDEADDELLEARGEHSPFQLAALDLLRDVSVPHTHTQTHQRSSDNQQQADRDSSSHSSTATPHSITSTTTLRKGEDDEDDSSQTLLSPSASKKEKRVSRACIHCSNSKTRCNNERPCARCIRTNREATCQDVPKRKRAGRGEKRRRNSLLLKSDENPHTCHVKTQPPHDDVPLRTSPIIAMHEASSILQPGVTTSHVSTYSSHTTLTTHDSHCSGYARSSHSSISSQSRTPHDPHSPPQFQSTTAQPSKYPVPHSAFAPSDAQYGSGGREMLLPRPPVHAVSVRAIPMQPSQPGTSHPPHATPPATEAVSSVRAILLDPSPKTSSTPSQSVSLSPITPQPITVQPTVTPPVPAGQVLSRLRLLLSRGLHRAHGAVIDQFHHWSDLLLLKQQQGLPAPDSVLKARQYTYHMLKDAMLALEDEERQRRLAGMSTAVKSRILNASPSPTVFSPPLQSEHDELVRLIHHDWRDYLFPRNTTGAKEEEGENDIDNFEKVKLPHPTLDMLLQRRVVPPTFIIPLLSFPFLTSAPFISASFAALLDYTVPQLQSKVSTPLDLLHLRQYADIAPLVRPFLATISEHEQHYLHSSGWMRRGGEAVQLVANIRIMYAENTQYPVALMAQFTRREDADQTYSRIMQQGRTAVRHQQTIEQV